MARKGKKNYNWFRRPYWRFVGRRRRCKVVPPVINPPTELREQGPICGPVVIPNQHFRNTISHSVVELTIVGSSYGQPISVPGIILLVKQNLVGILFGGNLIREGYNYSVRLPNMVETKEVHFEDFMIKVKVNDRGEEARLALLSYCPEQPEVLQPCHEIQLGVNCSRSTLVFLYDFRLCFLLGDSDVYESSLNDGHVTISDHSTFEADCPPVDHSYHGGLIVDLAGKLVGIAFDKENGPIRAFQMSFILSALLDPEAESIDDIFLNVRPV